MASGSNDDATQHFTNFPNTSQTSLAVTAGKATLIKIEPFHGERSKYKLFVSQLQTHFLLNRAEFNVAEKKVVFA
jgi:hypothetical protein